MTTKKKTPKKTTSPRSPKLEPVPEPAPETGESSELFEAPPAEDLQARSPAPEEVEIKAVWEGDEESNELEAAAEVVDMLDALIQETGEPRLATWERALLIWSIEGLDISILAIPQPQRALAGCGVVGAARIIQRRRRPPEVESVPTPED